jgi:hypothetical protein
MRAFGVVLIVLGTAGGAALIVLRDRYGREARDALGASAGFAIGLGAAAVQTHPGAAIVLVPLALAIAGAAQAEFLFAPGGPLRTSTPSEPGDVSSGRIMVETIEEPAQPPEPVPAERVGRSVQRSRRTRVVVRRVGPLSILKFSLIFYFCVMLVFFFAMLFLWGILSAAGLTVKVQHDIDLLFPGFAFDSTWIFERLFAIGLGLVIVWSIINTLICFMYNLISDLVGGIEITLAEKR